MQRRNDAVVTRSLPTSRPISRPRPKPTASRPVPNAIRKSSAMRRPRMTSDTALLGIRVGLISAAAVAAVALAEVELGVACLIAAVKLMSELPLPESGTRWRRYPASGV